ncbi:MAG: hypothetical protein Q7N87_03780 [Candidatus Uhrbacteria bacterium]|nr:hypothetical protein [Candidatus Uhrbacteria bacterium]
METILKLLGAWWQSYRWGFGSTKFGTSRIGWRMRIFTLRAVAITVFSYYILPAAWAARHEKLVLWGLGWFVLDTFVSLFMVSQYRYARMRGPRTDTGHSIFSLEGILRRLGYAWILTPCLEWRITVMHFPQTLMLVVHAVIFVLQSVDAVFYELHRWRRHRFYRRHVRPAVEEREGYLTHAHAAQNEKVATEIAYALALIERVQKARIARSILEAQFKALVLDDSKRKAMMWDAAERVRSERQAVGAASSAGAA